MVVQELDIRLRTSTYISDPLPAKLDLLLNISFFTGDADLLPAGLVGLASTYLIGEPTGGRVTVPDGVAVGVGVEGLVLPIEVALPNLNGELGRLLPLSTPSSSSQNVRLVGLLIVGLPLPLASGRGGVFGRLSPLLNLSTKDIPTRFLACMSAACHAWPIGDVVGD